MLRALLLGLLTVFATASCSKQADAPSVAVGTAAGKVVDLAGKVSATREGKTRELALGGEVFRDDQIATSADATVTIELFHNGAKWAVVSNKTARVDSSLAWGLDKQEASKAVEHNSAAAGRNAERSAADTASTTGMQEPAKPGAAPSEGSAPTGAAPTGGAPATPTAPPIVQGGQRDENAAPPPPPPPPPPRPVAKIEKKGASRGAASAPKDMAPMKTDDAMEQKETDSEVSVVVSPQTLAERQRPALQKCLDKATKVTLTIDVRKNKTTTTVKGTGVTDKVRTCMDAVIQKIEWPVPGATAQVVLKLE